MVCSLAEESRGGVVVLANRTPGEVRFWLTVPGGKKLSGRLAQGKTYSTTTDGALQVVFRDNGVPRAYDVDVNSAHFFHGTEAGGIDLHQIGFREGGEVRAGKPVYATQFGRQGPDVVIPVKLLVDENDPSTPRFWQEKLRKRMERVSKIVDAHCGVRFEVVAFGKWESDDRLNDFPLSLREFEQEVEASPARLAIGFTSQYTIPKGRTNLGGTRGPLKKHILIREWSKHVSESERMEVLLHEVGHFLGATHSPEPTSVMRPVLGDRQARSANFLVTFDPVNTLIMSMVAEEMRRHRIKNFDELSPRAKLQLREIYAAVDRALPGDPAAAQFGRILRRAGATPLAEGARLVVDAISRSAQSRRGVGGEVLSGDRLTERYVRSAAAAAAELPEKVAVNAFLVGLAVSLDRSNTVRKSPLSLHVGKVYRSIESDQEREQRLRDLGIPKMHGRHDLLQHFVVSSALVVLMGSRGAETVGIFKEVSDSRGGSGFSFADLAADLSGIRFAEELRNGTLTLDQISRQFNVESFVLGPSGLPEGLSQASFREAFGSTTDRRFSSKRDEIKQRIAELPGFQAPRTRLAEDNS